MSRSLDEGIEVVLALHAARKVDALFGDGASGTCGRGNRMGIQVSPQGTGCGGGGDGPDGSNVAEGGRYASVSEVVRHALRLLEEEQQRRAATLEALRAEVKKGLASGKGQPAEEVFERLERKYANLATTRRSK